MELSREAKEETLLSQVGAVRRPGIAEQVNAAAAPDDGGYRVKRRRVEEVFFRTCTSGVKAVRDRSPEAHPISKTTVTVSTWWLRGARQTGRATV